MGLTSGVVGIQVMRLCESRGVAIRVATKKLIAEEAPESYKDVSQVSCLLGSRVPACTLRHGQHWLDALAVRRSAVAGIPAPACQHCPGPWHHPGIPKFRFQGYAHRDF